MLLNTINKINSIDKVNNDNVFFVDEMDFIQKKFKMNFIDFKNNDITYEIINHNSKYYFFHFSVFDKILKTHKNPYNNKLLNNHIIDRIFLKNQINKLIINLKFFYNNYDFNNLYDEFINYDHLFLKKLNFYFITYLVTKSVNYRNINENIILQISSNLNYRIRENNNIEVLIAVLGYLICNFL